MSRALGLFIILGLVLGCSKTKLAPEFEVVKPVDGLVQVDVSSMKPGDVRFYTYKYRGRNIDFMVIKFSGADVRTYLDADYMCYKMKMGFGIKDGKIYCRHHGFEFELMRPETWKGAHRPIPLKSDLKDGRIIISEDSLKKAYRFFR